MKHRCLRYRLGLAAWAPVVALVVGNSGAAGQTLYSVEVVAPHSRLSRIDHLNGSVAKCLTLQENVVLNGLTYDPSTATLFGASTSLGDEGLFTIDANCGAYARVADLDRYLPGLAIQPGTFELFGLTLRGELFAIDKQTGAGSFIGGTGLMHYAHGLAFSPDGRLYCADTIGYGTSKLFELDPQTGQARLVGIMNRDYIVSLAFGPGGVLYGSDNGTGTLVTIDPRTAQVTTVGPFGDGVGHSTIAFVPEPVSAMLLAAGGITVARRRRR